MNEELKETIISNYTAWNKNVGKEEDKKVKKVYKEIDKFVKKFTLNEIRKLSKDGYVEGKGCKDTFCYWVENKLNEAGNIHGATAHKFGLYYSQTKEKYVPQGYNSDPDIALSEIKEDLISLINASQSHNVDKIDEVRLSNMFRHKIVYLYNREHYLPIYSEDHIDKLLIRFDLPYIKKNQ